MKFQTAVFVAFIAAAHAGPRSSLSYSINTETTDAGGRRATSALYTNDGTVGAVSGLSTVTAPAETVKGGFVGQLSEVTGLLVNASASSLNETATLQLAAWQRLDDTSFITVNTNSVAWGVGSGPITSISTSGLATAGTVAQNTAATVQGTFSGFTGTLNLTVLDTIPDNFGSYAADGLPDDWQVQYFGQPPNTNAGPNADPTGNGQNNLFKYIAGLNPLDVNVRFVVSSAPVAGQPGQLSLTFHPVVSGRTYTVKFRTDLATGSWLPLIGAMVSNNGTERTVTDTGAAGAQKFYHIEITKP